MLIKIGEFARQTGVTVKTLHHYEKSGLLKPAWINRFNGYRYYTPEQQARLELLLAYKEMGFPLSQIGKLLDRSTSNQEFITMLENRLQAIETQIQNEKIKLEKVKTCLSLSKKDGGRLKVEHSLSVWTNQKTIAQQEIKMEITIKQIPALKLVGLRYQGKNENKEIAAAWTTFNQRSGEIKNQNGAAAYGICSIPAGLAEGEFEYLCALPVDKFEDVPQGLVERNLEAMRAAVFVHRGSYETLGDTYSSIYQTWLPEASLQALENGFDLEVYTDEFKDFAPDSVMYIYVPIKG